MRRHSVCCTDFGQRTSREDGITWRSRGPLIPRSRACLRAPPRALGLTPRRQGSRGCCLRSYKQLMGTPTFSSIAQDWPFPRPRLGWAASGPGQASCSGRGDEPELPGGDALWGHSPAGRLWERRSLLPGYQWGSTMRLSLAVQALLSLYLPIQVQGLPSHPEGRPAARRRTLVQS